MANHGPTYGLDADLAAKRAAQYDAGEENEARQFISQRSGSAVTGDFHGALKSGVILCALANAIKPGSCRVGKGNMPFVQMENISQYLAFCGTVGLKTHDLFQTVDLYEAKNMNQVIKNILALKRSVGGGAGGAVGNRPAQVNIYDAPDDSSENNPAPSTLGGAGGTGPAGAAVSGGGAKFCANCGTPASGGKFCANCGNAL